MLTISTVEKFQILLDQLAMEIVMAQPGSDNGLLPILDLLNNLSDQSSAHPELVPFHESAQEAFVWMASIVETGKLLSQQDLDRLNEILSKLRESFQHPKTSSESPSSKAPSPESTAPQNKRPSAEDPENGTEEVPLSIDIQSDGELLREFINESHEHLQNIEQGALILEKNPLDIASLNLIFRAFHTFKGGAGFLNLVPIQELAHVLESLLDLTRQNRMRADTTIINFILEGSDILKQFVLEIEAQLSGKKPLGPCLIPTEALKQSVRRAMEGKSAPLEDRTAPLKEKPAENFESAVSSIAHRLEEAPGSGLEPAVLPRGGTAIKIETQKLDNLLDLVGELVIAESLVVRNPGLDLNNQQLSRNLSQLNRITKELQRITMSMRMVPIRATFQKMSRIVRDLAAKQGKEIQLRWSGDETELDRSLVEELSDPLMHMIRNSVDHGIERPDLRMSQGKPAQGTIELRAFHQGGNIVIEVKDDGAGLNRKRILAKAVEKGFIPPNAALREKEIFGLIFTPGFSTADTVTDLSGRGVGMDVVLSNIEKLRGKIEIESLEGQGSKFMISLPLTLAIIDALIVRVGEHRYILPTLSVRESLRPTSAMISTVHERGEAVKVRGNLIPLLRIHEYFRIEPRSVDPTQGIVIVVESGHESRCLLVDELMGKQEVVIKSLGETFQPNRALAGAAILGDGRVGLILDVGGLIRMSQNKLPKAA